jgi:hypothetical protein
LLRIIQEINAGYTGYVFNFLAGRAARENSGKRPFEQAGFECASASVSLPALEMTTEPRN